MKASQWTTTKIQHTWMGCIHMCVCTHTATTHVHINVLFIDWLIHSSIQTCICADISNSSVTPQGLFHFSSPHSYFLSLTVECLALIIYIIFIFYSFLFVTNMLTLLSSYSMKSHSLLWFQGLVTQALISLSYAILFWSMRPLKAVSPSSTALDS